MKENEFKFEPIWVSALGLFSLYLVYNFYKSIIVPGTDYLEFAVFSILPIFLGILILPMAFKMIIGIPAIEFTGTELVDNVFGISIRWENIQDIRISGVSKPFLSITLKDKNQFWIGIRNPVKRILLRFLFLISPGDVSINLAFVAGSNEAISALAQVYWNRFYGRFD